MFMRLGLRVPAISETITGQERGVIVAIAQIFWYKHVNEKRFRCKKSGSLPKSEKILTIRKLNHFH